MMRIEEAVQRVQTERLKENISIHCRKHHQLHTINITILCVFFPGFCYYYYFCIINNTGSFIVHTESEGESFLSEKCIARNGTVAKISKKRKGNQLFYQLFE